MINYVFISEIQSPVVLFSDEFIIRINLYAYLWVIIIRIIAAMHIPRLYAFKMR